MPYLRTYRRAAIAMPFRCRGYRSYVAVSHPKNDHDLKSLSKSATLGWRGPMIRSLYHPGGVNPR